MKQFFNDSWSFPAPARRTPVILQQESAECGLACLAMILGWHGHDSDMMFLRRRFSLSMRGTSLKQLIEIAGRLGFDARPVRLELDELASLRRPCILHWDLNHFVVMTGVSSNTVTINDPARGRRFLSLADARQHFTGVALEVWPNQLPAKEPRPRRLSLHTLLRGSRGLWGRVLKLLALALSLEAVILLSPFTMQWVIDGAIVSADKDLLVLLAIGFSLLVLVQAAIGLARSWLILDTSSRLAVQWNGGLFSHLLQLPFMWFERRRVGEIASHFASLATLNRALTTKFVETFIDGLMAAATLLLMFAYSASLTAIAVASSSLYAIARWAQIGHLRAATNEQVSLAAKANSILLETVRAVAAVKVFNHEQSRQTHWLNATVEATNRSMASERATALAGAVQTLLFGLENVLIVCLGAVAVMDGTFSIGMLLAFVTYRAIFSGRVAALVDKWMQLQTLAPHQDRIAEIALEPREETTAAHISAVPRDATLEVKGVWFRYGEADPWVLQDVSLSIKPGECLAITGESGCGKTTLIKLLMGLLSPCRGEILLGGARVAALGLREYRRRISGVLQEDYLLAGSIAENIAFLEAQADRDRIEACARIAAVHEEIIGMPTGYETLVGDMGSSLSGGQRQRILLARALYKRPEILFLDEATSHLDVRKEGLVNASVATLRLTRIVVAHRPQTIATVERVVVLERGSVKQDLRVSTEFKESFPRATGFS